MKLEVLAGGGGGAAGCAGKHCPTIYRSDRGTIVVQGYRITEHLSIDIPEGESAVEIPADLIKHLVESGNFA